MTADTEARVRAAVDQLADALLAAIRERDDARAGAPERLYDLRRTAELLGGLSRSALYEGPIAHGDLRVTRVGRRVMVAESAIRAYIASRNGDAGSGRGAH